MLHRYNIYLGSACHAYRTGLLERPAPCHACPRADKSLTLAGTSTCGTHAAHMRHTCGTSRLRIYKVVIAVLVFLSYD